MTRCLRTTSRENIVAEAAMRSGIWPPQAIPVSGLKESIMGRMRLLWSNRHERASFRLYGAGVAAAREPFLYIGLGVPDTLDGRFDMVGLYVFLIIQRLKSEPSPGPALAQAVFDAMFSDMDVNLREMGVGDLSVGRKVRIMWEAFHGRASAYATAMTTGDISALEAALSRNVWRGAHPPNGSPQAVSRVILAQQAHLSTQSLEALTAGTIDFLSAREVCQRPSNLAA